MTLYRLFGEEIAPFTEGRDDEIKRLKLHGRFLLPISYQEKFSRLREKAKSFSKSEHQLAKTFSGQLFEGSDWFLLAGEKEQQITQSSDVPSNGTSEKVKVIESLKNYAETKTETKEKKVVNFPGGQLEVLPSQNRGSELSFQKKLDQSNQGDAVDVIFLGDPQREGDEDLLGKMISAMKLDPKSYLRLPLEELLEDEDKAEFVEKFAENLMTLKPKCVLCLGAAATNLLLGRRERLSLIHGHFLESRVTFDDSELSYHLVPIFHPDFLVINPKMKRTAWIDLQQVMEFLAKN